MNYALCKDYPIRPLKDLLKCALSGCTLMISNLYPSFTHSLSRSYSLSLWRSPPACLSVSPFISSKEQKVCRKDGRGSVHPGGGLVVWCYGEGQSLGRCDLQSYE